MVWRRFRERGSSKVQLDFSAKVVLISGGTSGIGLATAKLFLASGATVVINGRDVKRGQLALQELSDWSDRAAFIAGDVTRPGDCRSLLERTCQQFGRLDVLVHSVGEYLEKSLSDTAESDFDRIMSVNMKGPYFLTQSALPALKKSRGNVVCVASDAGLNGNVLCTAYCASKGALTLFAKALSLELAPYGVRVNCVCPGDIETPMLARQVADAPDPETFLRQMAAIYPLGRIGTAQEVASVILFLASDAAAFVTGAAWSVDGGLTAG